MRNVLIVENNIRGLCKVLTQHLVWLLMRKLGKEWWLDGRDIVENDNAFLALCRYKCAATRTSVWAASTLKGKGDRIGILALLTNPLFSDLECLLYHTKKNGQDSHVVVQSKPCCAASAIILRLLIGHHERGLLSTSSNGKGTYEEQSVAREIAWYAWWAESVAGKIPIGSLFLDTGCDRFFTSALSILCLCCSLCVSEASFHYRALPEDGDPSPWLNL